MSESITPYGRDSKKEEVAQMFDNIAHKYDFLNHFMSLGIDKLWRKQAIAMLRNDSPKFILDVATGTADLAIDTLKLQPDKVIGVDISKEMLSHGRVKLKKRGLDQQIELRYGDSEALEFPDNHFDASTSAYGVRNFENLNAGLKEIYRVLKPGGKLVILEFSKPGFPVKQLFDFYFSKICPLIGRLVSSDGRAYSYLHESVAEFPDGEDFLSELRLAGFKEVSAKRLTFGISSIYVAKK
ncbi:MAG: demethylmenaquinone methyltransferase/2-methoxy-6-polyprenyl-1,4-benzoquinol methylase [Limisphaerales bacterium]